MVDEGVIERLLELLNRIDGCLILIEFRLRRPRERSLEQVERSQLYFHQDGDRLLSPPIDSSLLLNSSLQIMLRGRSGRE